MRDELKTYTLNLKSLDQEINDPIIAGSGDVNGWTFRVVLTQTAAKQIADGSKLYLNWHHLSADVYGYNVFTRINENTWELYWPVALTQHKGDVLARIELVDQISIAPSVNFTIRVLSNPNDDRRFEYKDDYSVFSLAVLELNSALENANKQMEEWRCEFQAMRNYVAEIRSSIEAGIPEDMTIKEYIDSQDNIMLEELMKYIDEKLEGDTSDGVEGIS